MANLLEMLAGLLGPPVQTNMLAGAGNMRIPHSDSPDYAGAGGFSAPMPAPAPQPAPQPGPMPAPQPQPSPQPQPGGGGLLQRLFGGGESQGYNETVQWLQRKGYDPGQAMMIAKDKPTLQKVLLSAGGQDEYTQRATAALKLGLKQNDPAFKEYVLTGKLPATGADARAKFGLQPQYGVDANGNPVLLQISDSGEAATTKLPEGVQLSKEPIKLDAGTHWVLLDPITRQPVGQIPKEIAAAETQKAVGKAQGEAAFDLPRIEQNAAQTVDLIERLKNHPGRAGSTGFIQGRLPAYSGDTQDFQTMLAQAKGQTFMQAYQSLKGGGQITEVEGQKAEAAIARLERAQSDEAFMKALDDFESVIKVGLDHARRQAGKPSESTGTDAPAGEASGGDTPPASYDGDPNLWKYMTPEQRKLWQ